MRFLALFLFISLVFPTSTFAVVDPREAPNNKVGINVLSPQAEIKEASDLVNSNGDWGWVVIIIKRSERDVERWQTVFNQLNKHHIIPIVRIATDMDSAGYWKKPDDRDAKDWADFLNKLKWPTKNRYVQVYNEVNRATEWGGVVDAPEYSKELNKTIDALKGKSDDFFVLNAPLDLSLPTSESSLDASVYFQTMKVEVPNIFDKLDGWASHSYPNPGFAASPRNTDRTGIAGYKWELAQIKKELPVFITETGWKTNNGLGEAQIADYYKTAYETVWSDPQVVAVAPFLLNYIEPLFEDFSFMANHGEKKPREFYKAVQNLPKVKGEPARENIAEIVELDHPATTITKTPKRIRLEIENGGNFIWDLQNGFAIEFEGNNIEVEKITGDLGEIYPGKTLTAEIRIKSLEHGTHPYTIKVVDGDRILREESLALVSQSYKDFLLKLIKSAF